MTPRTLSLLAAGSLCLFGLPAAAAPEFVIKFATVAPDGTPWSKQMERMQQLIHERSKGRVKVKAYTGFSKGGEKSLVRRCIQGSLQMCGVTIGAVATVVNDLNVLELPYLFADSAEADRILDGPALPLIKELFAAKGLVFWGWTENGWRGFGSKIRPIIKPADLKGMKMRSQESRVHVETFKALGANPVPIALPEVLGALQTGVVDGYDNSPLYLFAASWHQQTKYFTLTNHIYQPAGILFNKAFFDKLPADLQKVVMSPGEEVTIYGRKLIRKINDPLIANMRSAGITVTTPTAAQVAEFAKATRSVHKTYRAQLSPKGRRLLDVIYRAKKTR